MIRQLFRFYVHYFRSRFSRVRLKSIAFVICHGVCMSGSWCKAPLWHSATHTNTHLHTATRTHIRACLITRLIRKRTPKEVDHHIHGMRLPHSSSVATEVEQKRFKSAWRAPEGVLLCGPSPFAQNVASALTETAQGLVPRTAFKVFPGTM